MPGRALRIVDEAHKRALLGGGDKRDIRGHFPDSDATPTGRRGSTPVMTRDRAPRLNPGHD
jgi:hypothetical protein